MKLAARIRDRVTGVGENMVAVDIQKVNGGLVIVSPNTDATGFFSDTRNGSPGVIEWKATDAGETRVVAGDTSYQTGTIFTGELEQIFAIFGNGIIYGKGGQLAVTPGTGLQLHIADGVGFKNGMVYVGYTPWDLTIAPNASGNPRIDLIVMRLYQPPSGQTRGQAEIAVIAGTPAVSPVAPAPLAESGGAYRQDVPLATLDVVNGASGFTGPNIHDARTYAPGSILDGSVTLAKLAAGLVGTAVSTIAAGNHVHTDRATRGYFSDGDGNSAASTPSTSNLEANGTVSAFTLPTAIPVGTWTIRAHVGLQLKQSNDNQISLAAEIDGVENIEHLTVESAHWTHCEHVFARAGIVGPKTVNTRVRFCNYLVSGIASARNPSVDVTFERTA